MLMLLTWDELAAPGAAFVVGGAGAALEVGCDAGGAAVLQAASSGNALTPAATFNVRVRNTRLVNTRISTPS
jgi:hypothetical protein